MKIINLTTHTLNIFSEDKEEVISIEPSGQIARISVETKKTKTIAGIPFFKSVFGKVEGLPNKAQGCIYVVSSLVLVNTKDRNDVFAPGELLRNDEGQPIGCIGLSQ